jgi:hypothetical protein
MKNGAFINPITGHRSMPPADPVPDAQMVAFVAARDRALGGLGAPPLTTVANRNGTVQ